MTTATETTETVSNWNGSQDTVTRVTFGSEADDERMVFCWWRIRVSMSHNDTSNDQQGTSWEDLTVEMGTYRISVRHRYNNCRRLYS